MTIEVKVPGLPESVADATIANWYFKEGDTVTVDENLVDLETDKVMLEVPAPASGVITSVVKAEGSTVTADELIATIDPAATNAKAATNEQPADTVPAKSETAGASVASKASAPAKADTATAQAAADSEKSTAKAGPAARRLAQEAGIATDSVQGTGKGGRVTTADVKAAVQVVNTGRIEERVPMSRLRARIAERLLSAQQNAAILTTFNEVNLQAVMDLRQSYKETFEKSHGIKLGFMSFFVKAAVEALKRFPSVNASVDGTDMVYHGYYDIGVAVSTEKGLVVPILRDADKMSMADIEKTIRDFGQRAQAGKLAIEEMTGGTFTVSNGGVFGSMLSTPILNPPQSAILGMHRTDMRPIVENGEIVIRPMMYLALSYDHRIIDGKESVTFLRTIKELLEDPARMLLDV